MKKGEFTINKWHFRLGICNVYWTRQFMFHFGIFKLLDFPSAGAEITKKNYKGFWIRKYWYGFDIGFYI